MASLENSIVHHSEWSYNNKKKKGISMCIVSYLAAKQIFARQEHDENKKMSNSFLKIMGPDFDGYLKDRDQHRACMEKMPYEDAETVSDDGLQLHAYYYKNPVPAERTVILVHGHHSNGLEGHSATGMDYLKHGYNALLIDQRSCGKSEGEWGTFGLKERYDLMKWIAWLKQKDAQMKIVLHGCSLGGATVCMCADLDLPKNVKAIVSDCAFADIREQLKYAVWVTAHVPGCLVLPQILLWLKHYTGAEIDDNSPLHSVSRAKVPMLFIHGTEDHYVLPVNAEKLYEACSGEKELLWIEHAGHASARYTDPAVYDEHVFHFLEKYTEEKAI
jgi:fermentation-respiration switch protein FrsA (DUF1100 family)